MWKDEFPDQLGPEAVRAAEVSPSPAISPVLVMVGVVSPAIFYGYPTGHDSFLHTSAWFDVLSHWREGNWLPAWGARFAMGWGQPVHLFYPPRH